MVFHFHRQSAYRRVVARHLGHRPRLHHAVELEAEVVVQVTRRMLLHHEMQRLARGLGYEARWLLRPREVALAVVLGEWRRPRRRLSRRRRLLRGTLLHGALPGGALLRDARPCAALLRRG